MVYGGVRSLMHNSLGIPCLTGESVCYAISLFGPHEVDGIKLVMISLGMNSFIPRYYGVCYGKYLRCDWRLNNRKSMLVLELYLVLDSAPA